jgi:hypothetical protein
VSPQDVVCLFNVTCEVTVPMGKARTAKYILVTNVTQEFTKQPTPRLHYFNILIIYKHSITPFILLFLGVNNKNTTIIIRIVIIFLILLFSYHRPYVILHFYCKAEYCKTVVSDTKHGDVLYITFLSTF